MKKTIGARVLLLALVWFIAFSPASPAKAKQMPFTAGVFFLLAQEMVELPVGTAGAELITAELSADLLSLCAEDSFGGKDQTAVRQVLEKALENLTDEERKIFMMNFERKIVPCCDGILAGDPQYLGLLSDADAKAFNGTDAAGEAAQESHWKLLKTTVLSLK